MSYRWFLETNRGFLESLAHNQFFGLVMRHSLGKLLVLMIDFSFSVFCKYCYSHNNLLNLLPLGLLSSASCSFYSSFVFALNSQSSKYFPSHSRLLERKDRLHSSLYPHPVCSSQWEHRSIELFCYLGLL